MSRADYLRDLIIHERFLKSYCFVATIFNYNTQQQQQQQQKRIIDYPAFSNLFTNNNNNNNEEEEEEKRSSWPKYRFLSSTHQV